MLALCLTAATACADDNPDSQARATHFATCAAYYFNAVNVKPMKEYEEVYQAGERSFNEGLKLVGRKALDDLVAHAAGDMTKLMNSDWKNFRSVEQRYAADCQKLLDATPVTPVE